MQDAFDALHAWTRQRTLTLARHVAEGFISPTEFGDRMADLLTIAHTRAVALGRHHAGDTAPLEADDREFAERVVDGEAEFLAAFVRDIAAGRYRDEDGEPRLASLQNRSGMYADRLLGTANETWTLAQPLETQITWHLNDGAEHCRQCPGLAAASPWRPADLDIYPASGATDCLTSCRCWLTTDAGQVGFRLS